MIWGHSLSHLKWDNVIRPLPSTANGWEGSLKKRPPIMSSSIFSNFTDSPATDSEAVRPTSTSVVIKLGTFYKSRHRAKSEPTSPHHSANAKLT